VICFTHDDAEDASRWHGLSSFVTFDIQSIRAMFLAQLLEMCYWGRFGAENTVVNGLRQAVESPPKILDRFTNGSVPPSIIKHACERF
jgi:hypothetical protein